MFAELWQYVWLRPKLPYVKAMGFAKESIAMQSRAKRCAQQWQSHYQHCQRAITDFVQQQSSHQHIMVMGAGSTQDIPLEYLSQTYQKVTLVDLVFLPAARKRCRAWENIELLEYDVTQSLHGIWLGSNEVKPPNQSMISADIDAVISLNLVTQLPLLPLKWLRAHYSLSDAESEVLAQSLIQNHLNFLRRCRSALLIADVLGQSLEDGKVVDEYDPWWGIDVPHSPSQWTWEIIPDGEVRRHYQQRHRVMALSL